MNDVFFVPMAIATVISYLGFACWIVAYGLAWGYLVEGLSLGVAVGGLLCGVVIGVAEPIEAQKGNGGFNVNGND